MPHAKVFGIRVRERRRALKMTQDQLAQKVGVDASYIGKIERGERMNINNLYKIAAGLETTLSELFK